MGNELAASQDTIETVREYFIKGEKGTLTPKEKEMKGRWEKAFQLLMEYRSKAVVVRILQEQDQLSRATAFRDVQAAESLFGNVQKYNKEILRYQVIESAHADIHEIEKRLYPEPDKNGEQRYQDPSSSEFSRFFSLKHKAELRIIRAGGLEVEDPDLPDFSKLKPHIIKINVPEQVVAAMQAAISKGVVNMNDYFASNSEDAEDISEETEEGGS